MMIVDQTTVAFKPMTIIGRVELSPAWKINAFANQVIPDSREPFLLACRCRAGAAMFGADSRFQQSNLI